MDEWLDDLELMLHRDLRPAVAEIPRLVAAAAGADSPRLTDRVELLRADIARRLGRTVEATARLRMVAARAAERDDDALGTRVAYHLATSYYGAGLAAEAQAFAEAGIRPSARWRSHWPAQHTLCLALLASPTGRSSQAEFALYEESLRLAREHGSVDLIAHALNNYAWVARAGGDTERARGLAEEIHRLATGGATLSLLVIDTLACIRLDEGRQDEAAELLERGIAAGRINDVHVLAETFTHLAAIRRRQGQTGEARRLLEAARASLVGLGESSRTLYTEAGVEALTVLAELDAEAGDHRRAYRRLRRLLVEQQAQVRVETDRRAAVLASVHATAIERERREHFEQLAHRDGLTALYNRRYVDQHLPELLLARPQAVMTAAIIDVDHFKAVNDRLGHDAGDAVLVRLADQLRAGACALPGDGFVARLGGDEFLLVAEGDQTRVLAMLQDLIAAMRWGSGVSAATVSIGAATVRTPTNPRDLLALADRALYEAKAAGRDCVRALSPHGTPRLGAEVVP